MKHSRVILFVWALLALQTLSLEELGPVERQIEEARTLDRAVTTFLIVTLSDIKHPNPIGDSIIRATFPQSLVPASSSITNEQLFELISLNPNLTMINLSYCSNITSDALFALVQRCPKLTSISLLHCHQISFGAVLALRVGCPHIRIDR